MIFVFNDLDVEFSHKPGGNAVPCLTRAKLLIELDLKVLETSSSILRTYSSLKPKPTNNNGKLATTASSCVFAARTLGPRFHCKNRYNVWEPELSFLGLEYRRADAKPLGWAVNEH